MDLQQIAKIYESTIFSTPPVSQHDPTFQFLVRYIPEDRRASILDAGCGNGRFACTLAELGYENIMGVDLYEQIDTGGLFEYRRNSVDALQLPSSSVDFLYSMSVIYYLDNPKDGFTEFMRVMKPGAMLVITAHTKYSLFTLDRMLRRALGRARHLRGVRFRSAREYTRLLQDVRFEVLDVDGIEANYFRTTVLGRLWRRFWPTSWASRQQSNDQRRTVQRDSAQWLRRLRSEVAYHSIIAARKPATPARG